MHTPFLSIITINYNNADGLRKTIESVKNQTSKDYEHIIIDGASTDQSISILKDFLKDENYAKQVSFWCSEKDKGVYDAMNKAIPLANGEYCLFLNSGDFLADNCVVERVHKYDLKDEIVYSNAILYTSKKEWKNIPPAKITLDFFSTYKTLNHQNMLFKTSFIREHPYSLEYKITADADLYFKAFVEQTASFKYINDVISKYEAETGLSSVMGMEKRHAERKLQIDKYIPNYVQEVLEELNTYENKYHGILKKIKNFFMLYSKIKNGIKRGNKK